MFQIAQWAPKRSRTLLLDRPPGYWRLGRALSREASDAVWNRAWPPADQDWGILDDRWKDESEGRSVNLALVSPDNQIPWVFMFSPNGDLEHVFPGSDADDTAWAALASVFIDLLGYDSDTEIADIMDTAREHPGTLRSARGNFPRMLLPLDVSSYALLGLNPWLFPLSDFTAWVKEMEPSV